MAEQSIKISREVMKALASRASQLNLNQSRFANEAGVSPVQTKGVGNK